MSLIRTTFPASKLINFSPSKLSLLISNKGINVITDVVKVLLLLGRVHIRQAEGMLTHI